MLFGVGASVISFFPCFIVCLSVAQKVFLDVVKQKKKNEVTSLLN